MMIVEPAKIILNYADRQAEAAKLQIYAAIASPFEPEILKQTSLSELAAIEVLTIKPSLVAFQRCITAIGALDFHFSAQFDQPGPLELIPSRLLDGDVRIKIMALQQPLVRRQLAQAQTDWLSLRESTLSFPTLRAYAATCAEAWIEELLPT